MLKSDPHFPHLARQIELFKLICHFSRAAQSGSESNIIIRLTITEVAVVVSVRLLRNLMYYKSVTL